MGKNIEGYWLRTKKWFFKWNKTTNIIGLFDMAQDPKNDKDLSTENDALVKEFQQEINQWISKRELKSQL